MNKSTGTNQVSANTATSEASEKKFNWTKLVLWLAAIDLVIAVVATVVQLVFLDALAGVVNYQGFGYVVAMIGTAILTFVVNLFISVIGTIVLAGGVFVIGVAVVSIFGNGRTNGATRANNTPARSRSTRPTDTV